jgi:hypothetical protein
MQDVENSDPVTYRTTQEHWFFNVTENQNVHWVVNNSLEREFYSSTTHCCLGVDANMMVALA